MNGFWKKGTALLLTAAMTVSMTAAVWADAMTPRQLQEAIELEKLEGQGEMGPESEGLAQADYGTADTVEVYSAAKDGEKYLSKNFQVKEFQSHDWADKILIDTELVNFLQKIRDHFGAPVNINSGYRTVSHNASVGGVKNSYHTRGMAADIKVSGVSPRTVAQYAESIGLRGVGLYTTFVHVDTRTTSRYFWNNETGREIQVSTFFQSSTRGDADGDGEISVNDALLVLKNVAGDYEDMLKDNADADQNGEITVNDVLLILKYIADAH